MQLFPVFEYFDGNGFFVFVIEAFKNNSKSSSSELFLNFVSVLYLVFCFINVVSLIIVKTKVVYSICISLGIWIFVLASQLSFIILSYSLILSIKIYVINHVVVHDFLFFIWWKMRSKVSSNFFWMHGECSIGIALLLNELFALGALVLNRVFRAWGLRLVISQRVISSSLFYNICEVDSFVATLSLVETWIIWQLVLSPVLTSLANALTGPHQIGRLREMVMRLVTNRRKLVLEVLVLWPSLWWLHNNTHICRCSIRHGLREGSNVWNCKVTRC